MTPAELAEAVRTAVCAAVDSGQVSLPVEAIPDEVKVERPKVKEHGDYATSIALVLAKPAGMPPRAVAAAIAERLAATPGVKSVDIAGPGFLNVVLDAAAQGELARTIVGAGRGYGTSETLAGERINLEFVSANPTGPVTMGSARWAAVGDSLARILQSQGASVEREYYFNDHGSQIDRFARSLMARAQGRPGPEDGYFGAYVDDIAAQVLAVHPDALSLPAEEAQELFRSEGVNLMFAEIKSTLHDFGVEFDVYFHENDLHESGAVERAVERLRALGRIYEQDGAVWMRTTDLGDDRDRVIIRSSGEPAYISGDLAYYLDKRDRGFDRVVIMLGADHHGYVSRLMMTCAAFGDEPGKNLEVLIGQMVNLLRDGEPLRMSKRAGTVLTMEDLVDAIGVDAARSALARSSIDSQIDIDLDVWNRRTNDNPVFYVQYAHARIASLLRNAADLGVGRGDEFDLALLAHDREGDLLGALGEFPRVIASAAEMREPHRVARYVEQLAGTYHRFYDACRVLPMGDEPATDLTRARLWLVEATRVVLANGLGLLGVTAPERM